jgi:hypothetical protein
MLCRDTEHLKITYTGPFHKWATSEAAKYSQVKGKAVNLPHVLGVWSKGSKDPFAKVLFVEWSDNGQILFRARRLGSASTRMTRGALPWFESYCRPRLDDVDDVGGSDEFGNKAVHRREVDLPRRAHHHDAVAYRPAVACRRRTQRRRSAPACQGGLRRLERRVDGDRGHPASASRKRTTPQKR